MLATQEGQQRNRGQISQLEINLISLLFVGIGLAALAFLIVSIINDPQITAATQNEDSILLAFLDSIGIIVPLVVILLSVFCFWTAWGLFNRDVNAAGWAQLMLLWLPIGGLISMALIVPVGGGTQDTVLSDWIVQVVLILGGAGIMLFGYWWIGNNINDFEGQEELFARSTRTAWNLLIPTMAVLLLIAARPLEQTFIASLTDRRFAGAEETNFVGLQNYAELLGFRLDQIPCETDDSGACLVEENRQGEMATVYPRPRDYLGDEYRELRYRTINEFDIFGTRFVLSARDPDFASAVGNTLFYTFFSVSAELILGIFIALVVNSNFAGRGVLRAAMLVPWAIPTVVSARLWETMLRDNSSGVINQFLLTFGLTDSSIAWLANPEFQLWSLIFVDVWKTTPFMALILLAGLQIIPSDIYEAAEVDGASRWRQFVSITLPLLRPTIAVALVFRTLDALRAFDVFQVLLGRQRLSMATYNYEMLVSNQQFGYASAIGVVMFILILLFTIAYVRVLGVSTE